MLALTPEQHALLKLPDPFGFLPKLAAEIRRDLPREVSHLNDQQLLAEVQRSYDHAAFELKLTRLPTLVKWVKFDVVSGGKLRQEPAVDLAIRNAPNPNLAAEDMLASAIAQSYWED
ncbi:hypothetical protein H0E84_00845 [Luteimonas sp. SJ-92]|uniref:Uncharacterized protein n=1 Tax=Luteimonas salinisoli TaxID=2752307 RepID=A0A853J825_9GAMM|nr:hypothetical protein [Luteimonas salinisoli]NZA24922.1 hypothetical protein [Luteimonas salinisoli]